MNKIPETIEELKFAYQAKNLPPEEITRFFIGKDYKGARAFGIYKDEITGKFIVYKNKGDGTRAIRYEGEDEAYAVKQLYIKLEEEIINQKANNSSDNYKSIRNRSQKIVIGIYIIFLIVMAIAFVISIFESFKPKRGYYLYDNDYYYYQNGYWYDYGEDDDWDIVYEVPKELKENYSDYYKSNYYYLNSGISNFENSSYYEEPSSSSDYSSDDYGDTWDSSDSWDSSSTDWSSDW